MTRKELEDLGLSKEQVDAVIKINGADIENAKSVTAAEIKNLQTQVSERDKQLETLKATAGDNEALTKQITELQAENTKVKEEHESELTQLKIDFAVEKALSGAKAKNVKAVKALLDLTDAKLDKEGKVKGLQEQIEQLIAGEDSKFLFDTQDATPQFQGFQPGASAGASTAGVDYSKMSYEQIAAYMSANPNA